MKTHKIIFLLLFFSILVSCRKDYISPTTSSGPIVVPSAVSFSVTIIPIFTGNCTESGCHASTAPADGLDLTTANAYTSLWSLPGLIDTTNSGKNAANSTLYTEINTGKMPKGAAKLSSQQIEDILAWIQQGAQNN